MGTRGLTMVAQGGEIRTAQYGQWDHYPTGQGQTIVEFLRDEFDKPRFLANLARVKVLTGKEVEERWANAGATSEFVTSDVADKFKVDNDHLSRDYGAKILAYIQEAANPEVEPLQTDFAADSLFCEWAYVVNLDNDTLEVYQGFNTAGPLPKTERFAYLNPKRGRGRPPKKDPMKQVYYPVKLVATYPFADLTPTTMQELEKRLHAESEAEQTNG